MRDEGIGYDIEYIVLYVLYVLVVLLILYSYVGILI
jgi:hypothetical protein